MPDPKKHADSRNLIESIMRWIPGFSGYLEKADRLDKAKPSLDELVHKLTSGGKLDGLDEIDRFRSRLDHMVGRFRSAPQGYSGFFDYVRVREEELNEVYVLDASMFQTIDELAAKIESIKDSVDTFQEKLSEVTKELEEVDRNFDKRSEILNGLSD